MEFINSFIFSTGGYIFLGALIFIFIILKLIKPKNNIKNDNIDYKKIVLKNEEDIKNLKINVNILYKLLKK